MILQKVRKQGIRFWQKIIYNSLIPTFGKHTVMMTNKPKVGINFYKLSLQVPESYSLFPYFL